MKPWIKRTLFGLAGVSLLLGGIAVGSSHAIRGAFDHERRGGDSHGQTSHQSSAEHHDGFMERLSDKLLGLNADQKQRLALLTDKLQAQRAALIGNITDPRDDIQALIAGEKFDRSRAQALVAEKTTVLNAQSPDVIAAFGDFYDSLNPPQQQKVRDFVSRKSLGQWRHTV